MSYEDRKNALLEAVAYVQLASDAAARLTIASTVAVLKEKNAADARAEERHAAADLCAAMRTSRHFLDQVVLEEARLKKRKQDEERVPPSVKRNCYPARRVMSVVQF